MIYLVRIKREIRFYFGSAETSRSRLAYVRFTLQSRTRLFIYLMVSLLILVLYIYCKGRNTLRVANSHCIGGCGRYVLSTGLYKILVCALIVP